MNFILGLTKNKTKGFVLGYVLYLFSFLLSFMIIVSSSVIEKSKIEANLIEMERQKCIELTFYSYFNEHPDLDSFELSINDYVFYYEVTQELAKKHLKLTIEHEFNQYTIHYYFDEVEGYINRIEYNQ